MTVIHVVGAGELGATLARRLAERELARRILLVDPEVSRAKGKALDIAQAGPVESFDVAIEAVADFSSLGGADLWIVADPPELETATGERVADLARALLAAAGGATIVVAGATAATPLVSALVARHPAPDRVLGSAPVAYAAALRRAIAERLGVEPREVTLPLLGLPPGDVVVPHSSVLVGGAPVVGFSAVALRQSLGVLRGRVLGPVALAAAAVRVTQALQGSRPSVLSVTVPLRGEYGHKGIALATPAGLAGGRVVSVVEHALDPVDRVALDSAAERSRRRTA